MSLEIIPEDPAVTRFRSYLKIKSVHPEPDYETCIQFIKLEVEEIGLEYGIVRFQPPEEFAIYATWCGSDPSLKSIMLNSHIDVVPVDASKWTHDAFSAYKDPQTGNIYARGTQDMKSVGMQYLEAIRKLKKKGFTPRRTIHVTFVPDEELGGKRGMIPFVKSTAFKNLNVGFGLDEGGASPTEPFLVFYGERALWQIRITVKGNTGHALHFIKNTAAEKTQKIINSFLSFRESEKAKLGEGADAAANLGNVTTVNLTMIQGGLQANVVPPEITITFDLRITPKWSQTEAEAFIQRVIKEAGDDITFEYINKGPLIPETPMTPENKWWTSFKSGCDTAGINILPILCPGSTDAKNLREINIPALGFSPMNNTPILLHDNNEFVNETVYLKGIKIYENIIEALCNTEGE